jgi:hypothetical protein
MTVTQTVTTDGGSSSVRARVTANTSSWAHVEYLSGPHGGTSRMIDLSGTGTLPTFSTGLQRATAGPVPSYGGLAEALVRTSELDVDRIETLDGHRTAVVSLVPESSTSDRVRVERRLWIDIDRRLPLQIETTWTRSDGQTVTETVRYTDIALYENGSVPAPSVRHAPQQSGVVGT